MALPFEIAIAGIPVSQQTRRRARIAEWRELVRSHAAQYWDVGDSPYDGPLTVTITYFYDRIPMDVDNLPKPILDALIGLVYEDDSQITDLVIRKRHLGVSQSVENASNVLRRALDRREPFAHILIEESESQEASP